MFLFPALRYVSSITLIISVLLYLFLLLFRIVSKEDFIRLDFCFVSVICI